MTPPQAVLGVWAPTIVQSRSACALRGFGGAPSTAGLPRPRQGWTRRPQACQPLHPLPRGLQLLGPPRPHSHQRGKRDGGSLNTRGNEAFSHAPRIGGRF